MLGGAGDEGEENGAGMGRPEPSPLGRAAHALLIQDSCVQILAQPHQLSSLGQAAESPQPWFSHL